MAKHIVSELSGPLLDAAVALAEGLPLPNGWNQGDWIVIGMGEGDNRRYEPSTDWSEGGPIIERERILVAPLGQDWRAMAGTWDVDGKTPLIAAMRAYVASKFGETVELP